MTSKNPNQATNDASSPTDEIPEEFLALQKAVRRPVLMTVVNDPIDESFFYAVAEELGDRTYPQLAWLLITYGGSAGAGFKTAKLVREQAKDLTALIPAQAASAGTVMAMSANSLVFGRTGALSAIDVQLDLSSEDGVTGLESSLAMRDALDEVKELSTDLLKMSLKQIHALTDLDQPAALQAATNLVGAVLAPITGRVNLESLGDRRRARNIGLAYGNEVLRATGYLTTEQRAKVLDELCFGLPTHGYPVMHDHATKLGLNASLATGELGAALDGLAYLNSYDGSFVKLLDYPSTDEK